MEQNNQLFWEQREPVVTEPAIEAQPSIEDDSPLSQLRRDAEGYNARLFQEKQAGLDSPTAYEKPSFDLSDYGLGEEVFAVLTIPALCLEMPVFLGACGANLAAGAAHLSETSLPIGGKNTNCVIAGHRGWKGAAYFRDLPKLQIGDEVIITNLWGNLTYETRHIASVFKLVQELLMQGQRGGNQFQELMQLLPSEHKAKWLAGSALTASDQAMNSIMSTVLSKLNAFLDTEMEQVLCFDGGIDAELFVKEKSAIFLILPEEDATKNFVASLMIQNLARELFSVANEHGGKLPNRAGFFCDELGTMPPFDILPLFSAGRSRRLTLVPIIQSLAQLEKNYGKEGAEILADNCQDTIFGGFAPNSQTAAALSENLGSRTVLSGSVTQGKDNNSQSLQMMERPLMSPDELKSMPKGSFVVMKTGTHPMKTKLKLFFDWGIRFEKPLQMEDRGSRPVHYAGKADLEKAILSEYPLVYSEDTLPAKPNMKAASMPEKTALKT